MTTVRPTDDPVGDPSTCMDRMALDHIATILRAPDWPGADFLQAISDIVRSTARSLDHPDACQGCGLGGWYGGECSAPEHDNEYDHSPAKEDTRTTVMDADDGDAPTYTVKYQDLDDEELGNHDAFASRGTAFAHFRAVVAEPCPGLGSVYITADDGGDEHVIAAHGFGVAPGA